MVERRNLYLRGLGGNATASVNQSITLNLGDIPQLKQLQEATQSPVSASTSPMQRLLRAAKENGGTLSIAQAAMYTELEPQEVKKLLQEAEMNGLAEITNDPDTGAIRYRFDV